MYGFKPDGVTVREPEADVIRECTERVLAGVSLRSLAADLREREAPCVQGGQWNPTRLRGILLRPRNAGLAVYQGEIMEDAPGPAPIVERATWEAVVELLAAEHRRTSPGPAPRWLGSGLYLCGHPSCAESNQPGVMRVGQNGRSIRSYRCEHGHLSRRAEPLDDFVTKLIVGRLAMPDAVDLVASKASVDTKRLSLRATELRVKISEAGDLWEDGTFTAAEYKVRRGRLQSDLDEINWQLKVTSGRDPVAELPLGTPEVAKAWKALSLGNRRAILAELMTVTVLPSRRGRPHGYKAGSGEPYLDPDSVRVMWVREP